MNNENSIKSITIASIKRHSMNVDEWKRTTISLSEFPDGIIPLTNELPITNFLADEKNWTLVTTHRIVGKINSQIRESYLNELTSIVCDNFKNPRSDWVLFKVTNRNGDEKDFLLEPGKPSIAIRPFG